MNPYRTTLRTRNVTHFTDVCVRLSRSMWFNALCMAFWPLNVIVLCACTHNYVILWAYSKSTTLIAGALIAALVQCWLLIVIVLMNIVTHAVRLYASSRTT